MFTIGALRHLEDVLRRRFKDDGYRLCRYFDLIGGTSTGSIIATGLALGMSVAEIAAYYKRMCPDIFKSPARALQASPCSLGAEAALARSSCPQDGC